MADARSVELLALASELERCDADLAGRIDSVSSLLRQVDEIRAGATEVRLSLDALPEQRAHAEASHADARVRQAAAELELAEASRRANDLVQSRRAGDDARATAERRLRSATIASVDAAEAVARVRERLEQLAGDEIALRAAAEGRAAEAGAVGTLVAGVPRISASGRIVPGSTLEEIEEWGARAHSALFVVRGSLENERERIVLEANGLAAAVLGEHVGGSSVALVRKHLEQSFADESELREARVVRSQVE